MLRLLINVQFMLRQTGNRHAQTYSNQFIVLHAIFRIDFNQTVSIF